MSSPDFQPHTLRFFVLAVALASCSGGSGALLSPAPVGPAAPQVRVRPAYGVIYSFKGAPSGASPYAPLIFEDGKLYGTTNVGGAHFNGTAFAISPVGTKTWLYSFKGGENGANPSAGLVDVKGTLYGTTASGGAHSDGAVFSISRSRKEAVLHSFGGGTDGQHPYAGLVDVNGTLYGTTASGGAGYEGAVFAISPAGKENVLHSFGAAGDGALPEASLTDVNGVLYGTTLNGGKNCKSNGGCGTVFEITTSGKEKVLYSFAGRSDGEYPFAGLVNVGGLLYGTTEDGGGSGCGYSQGCGTVFKISRSGRESVIYSFKGGSDGEYPVASLMEVKGVLYGTTEFGGTYDAGTVFAVSSLGKESVLHIFGGSGDGAGPLAGLINVSGTLYGTTESGGANGCYGSGCGTIFSLSP